MVKRHDEADAQLAGLYARLAAIEAEISGRYEDLALMLLDTRVDDVSGFLATITDEKIRDTVIDRADELRRLIDRAELDVRTTEMIRRALLPRWKTEAAALCDTLSASTASKTTAPPLDPEFARSAISRLVEVTSLERSVILQDPEACSLIELLYIASRVLDPAAFDEAYRKVDQQALADLLNAQVVAKDGECLIASLPRCLGRHD